MFSKIVCLSLALASVSAIGGYGGGYGGGNGGGYGGGYGGGLGGGVGGGYGHGHVAIAKHVEPVYGPQPYKFGYQIADHYGTKQHRQESSDEHNNKHGSYGYTDAHGIYREVRYVADAHGFRATVHTNEPGTAPSHPAAVTYHAPHVAQVHYGGHGHGGHY